MENPAIRTTMNAINAIHKFISDNKLLQLGIVHP
jgi:hypothetical protein